MLLKLGAYGVYPLVLPLYPLEAQRFAGWLAALATAAIVFGALGAWGQKDFKRLVAYSSINHMGSRCPRNCCCMGMGKADPGIILSANIALNGAVLQMLITA